MTAYSRYWRKNRSRHEATELALGLRALRKVAGHLGANVKPVHWKGMAPDEANAIILDSRMAQGRYPMAHSVFDLLTGQVVAEGLASMEWREWVISRTLRSLEPVSAYSRPFLEPMIRAAEDIHLHSLPKPKAWALYLEAFQRRSFEPALRDPLLPPSPQSLAQVWRQEAIMGAAPEVLHFYYELPLAILRKHVQDIAGIALLPSPGARREARVALYPQMWRVLEAALGQWEQFEADPNAVGMEDPDAPQGDLPDQEKTPAKDPEDEEEPGEKREKDPGLDPELAEEINSILKEGEADLTKMVAVAVEDPQAAEMPTVVRPGAARSDVLPDPLQVKRLSRVFMEHEALLRKQRRKKVRRGLTEGKLDPRRLHRAALDGKVFKARDTPGAEQAWRICIVADASSSMSGKGGARKPWPTAEKVFVSLAAAARGSRSKVDIFSYNEENKKCLLTRLNHSGEVFTVIPEGRTPSGQAIAAAASMLREAHGKSLIIHITDGAANCGCRLGDAIAYCRRSGIQVFTIGCGCNTQTRDFLSQYFDPGRLLFLRDIGQLSLGLERLLRGTMLHSVK